VYQQFVDDELVLAVHGNHPWARQGVVPLSVLLTEAFIQRERGSGSRLVIEQTFKQHGVDPALLRITAEMGSTEAIKQGIKAGIGVSILSRLALTEELRTGSLCAVTVQDVVFRRSFYIIRHKGRTLSPLGQTFARFLQDLDPAALCAPEAEANLLP
jgi:DNA-binding transcriptional LysR family regulator